MYKVDQKHGADDTPPTARQADQMSQRGSFMSGHENILT